MAWYRTGTASIANGATAVTGALTGWTSQVLPEDAISFDGGGKWYEIASVDSNTSITLTSAFAETTVSGGAYAIQRLGRGHGQVSNLAAQVAALLAQYPVLAGSGDADKIVLANASGSGLALSSGLRIPASGALDISKNAGTIPAAPTGGVRIVAADAAVAALMLEAFGQNTQIIARVSRGTAAAPTATQASDIIFQFAGRGYGASAYSAAARAAMRVIAAENWTDTAQGTYWAWYTTSIGAASMVERMRITDAGNMKLGGSANRGTTEGTNHLDIFDGTAPVGTLANGVSLYSTAGELRAMDAAGNATLISPHDKATNEWVYDSVDTRTGKRLRIDMERMMRAINAQFGWDFVHDFVVADEGSP